MAEFRLFPNNFTFQSHFHKFYNGQKLMNFRKYLLQRATRDFCKKIHVRKNSTKLDRKYLPSSYRIPFYEIDLNADSRSFGEQYGTILKTKIHAMCNAYVKLISISCGYNVIFLSSCILVMEKGEDCFFFVVSTWSKIVNYGLH